ncbi:MAG: phage shock protein PspA [Sphingomonadales bacterium]|nr:phage shock protein PspA [Sphingomonadales bacterium]
MGIFSRLSDIINSNINSILDRAEDPDKIIRLVIQEMEDTLVEVRSSAAKAIADQKDVERKLGRIGDAEAEWQRKAELALSKDREDLAKAALLEKAKLADMAEHLGNELEHLKSVLARHEEDVLKLEAKLREAKAKKQALSARHATVSNSLRVRRSITSPKLEEAFERFEKVERRIDRIEGEVESYDLGQGRTLDQEIADLEMEEAIESELDALKSKLAKSSAKSAKKAEAAEGGE